MVSFIFLLLFNSEIFGFPVVFKDIYLGNFPIFFLSNGFFMGLKKSNYAMINNMLRNVLVPICVFYLAKYLSADFDSFFWLWFIFQWTLSILLFGYVNYYIKKKLDKPSAILNPQP
mgnify:CR=1 FL=1